MPGDARHELSQARMSTAGSGRLATFAGTSLRMTPQDRTTASRHRWPPSDRKMSVTNEHSRAATRIANCTRAAASTISRMGTLKCRHTAALDVASSS